MATGQVTWRQRSLDRYPEPTERARNRGLASTCPLLMLINTHRYTLKLGQVKMTGRAWRCYMKEVCPASQRYTTAITLYHRMIAFILCRSDSLILGLLSRGVLCVREASSHTHDSEHSVLSFKKRYFLTLAGL